MNAAPTFAFGAVIGVGFEGTELPSWLEDALRHNLTGGIVLFRRNIVSLPQVKELCTRARRLAGGKLWIGIDEEGGRVRRLPEPFPAIPAAADIAATGDPGVARDAARRQGAMLRELGINVNFAPVLDVCVPGECPQVIGDRSYGANPQDIIAFAGACAEGLRAEGIAACGKHFPGHGSATGDSHLELPRLTIDRETWEQRDARPFAWAARHGLPAIMTAHVLAPGLGIDVPATFSAGLLTGQLRDRFGFEGIIVTDDLAMGAVGALYDNAANAAVQALVAGADVAMHCGPRPHLDDIVSAIRNAVEHNILSAESLRASARRVEHLWWKAGHGAGE